MFISGDLGGQWKCLKSEECSWSHLVATLDAWGSHCPAGIVPIRRNAQWTWMSVGDRAGCLSTCQNRLWTYQGSHITPTETRPIPSQRLHQIEQSPVDKKGLWINDVVSILIHVHPSDTIGNETRQTRQRVTSHQQSNGSVVGPRRGVKLCAVQSARYTSGSLALRDHINDGPLNSSHADTCRCPINEIRRNMRKCCTSISFKDSRLTSMVQFFQGLFPAAPMAEI
ncbi:hypothetical protein AVEN_244956-1 [Araneus ventricosus]|uniref:Uncharacterized protein n=1 Tax=Araneus ventricosus TaxID=182803 RepID=A0A4Y2FAJ8_ARAVE|nr:hypothetical protein AVEN_244956-1 [Araneus ventricosus]